MDVPADLRSYPEVPDRPDYPALEEEILAFWAKDETFRASVEAREGAEEFIFYDGPPFANGLPHYGHLLTGFVKDAIPRYQTMRGRHVERRFGWDCHGLPAETEAERELGVSGRGPITEFGIARFNDYCRTSVLRYRDAWQRYVTRQGRWVDFEHDYKTMDRSYMESVLWAFKALYERGLVYEGLRVLPYCWECETPLSNFETRQDDAYRERIDPAVTVRFRLEESGGERLNLYVWTTTPWTLPSNLALAVREDLDYAVFERDGERFALAEARVEALAGLLAGAERVGTVSGRDLVGRRYEPLFPYFASTPGAFRVLAADFVATDEGTGIVHLAPGFGEDDQRVCEAAGLPIVCPVDDRGRFDASVPDFAGHQVFAANPAIIDALERHGALVAREEWAHSYPHCWRTDTPLIYRAVRSFFVRVSALKERMVELNRSINWVPAHVRDGAFGRWLEGARDWSISRNRFWGAPIPVWKSDNPDYPRVDVYGSLDELEADFGVRPADLHRPAIDELTRPNPDDPTGSSTMRRVPDVLDCWFESGSMPFAQLHYPFEHARRFEESFPADFICEYVGQTRGWFYTLHVLATALFDRPAFSNCIAHGVVLGNDGRKLSKRLKNFPDPEDVFARIGADALRWYLLSAPVLRGLDVAIEEQAIAEPVRRVLNPIWNCWHFLALYGRVDGVVGRFRTDQSGVLDRYVLAKTRLLAEAVTAALDRYDLASATSSVETFLDALTNWYVRRSRERFWRALAVDRADKLDAYDTLHTVLVVLSKLVAPLLPFLAEAIFRGLTGERSVHLADWPDVSGLPADRELVESMDLARAVCSAAHSIRKAERRRARLPLRRLTVAGAGAARLAPFTELIADEVNVKEVVLTEDLAGTARTVLAPVPAALGPRLGPATQHVLGAARRGDWARDEHGRVVAGGVPLLEGEYAVRLLPEDERSSRVLSDEASVVTLDLEVTRELAEEGTARDLVRIVQQARKEAGLDVTDRIALRLGVPDDVAALLDRWGPELSRQTLATALEVGAPRGGDAVYALPDSRRVTVGLARRS
ncbi:MAG TPA: isoleucine--tRNA ligase [Acidimicrobiales bacterium]|nr:isoleucine--tRNA ligase [Acidimicrobiales bacterium]